MFSSFGGLQTQQHSPPTPITSARKQALEEPKEPEDALCDFRRKEPAHSLTHGRHTGWGKGKRMVCITAGPARGGWRTKPRAEGEVKTHDSMGRPHNESTSQGSSQGCLSCPGPGPSDTHPAQPLGANEGQGDVSPGPYHRVVFTLCQETTRGPPRPARPARPAPLNARISSLHYRAGPTPQYVSVARRGGYLAPLTTSLSFK